MGFDVEFVDPLPDHLKCPICLTAFEDAMQTECGHLFCKGCLDHLPVRECSVCKEPLQEAEVFLDRHVQREVMTLRVKCPHNNCHWTGTLREFLGDHSKVCEFEVLKCEHSECRMEYLRRDEQKHNEKLCKHRMVPCRRCGKQVPIVLMRQHNESDCFAGSVCCPMKCGRTLIQRIKLEEHKKVCPLRPVDCPFAPHGCKKKLLQTELKNHLMVALAYHTTLTNKITTRDAIIDSIKQPDVLQELQRAVASPSAMAAAAAQQRNLPPAVQRGDLERIESRIGSLQSQVRSCQEQVHAVQTQPGQRLALPAAATDGSSDDVDGAAVAILNDGKGPVEGSGRVGQVETIQRQQDRCLMELNTHIADLDLRINLCELATYNGVLMWKVTRWAERRREATSGRSTSIYSQPFYTGFHGYKCCTRLYPNGDGSGYGTHASLFFVVMQNEYDAIQEWPFRHKVTFSLLNQIPGKSDTSETFRPDISSSSFHRPSSSMNVASGCPKFAELKTIENPNEGFLTEEDCIFIRVEVDTSGIKKRPIAPRL